MLFITDSVQASPGGSSRHRLISGFIFALVLSSTGIAADDQQAQPRQEAQTAPAAEAAPMPEGELPLRDLRVFADVFNQIRTSYVEQVDDRTLLENAIKGMLNGLDPHSAYLDNELFDNLQESTSGEFGGLGLEVNMDGGFVRVIAPMDGTPAEAAGVQAGDLIIRLDDKSVKGLSLREAVELMRGERGTKITLTIVREGTTGPMDIEVTRDLIQVRSVRRELLESGIGYLRIAQFQTETGPETIKAVEQLIEENQNPLNGLILDLRNNPGGLLRASVVVSDAFLDDGLIVYTEGRIENSDNEFRAEPGDLLTGAPIVVLINGGSASASEIVAGALQDHRRAVVMGTTSFGKGSVQTVLPLGPEKAIKLTTARYFTPNGRSIQAQGIEPDIQVPRAEVNPLEPSRSLTEADLNRHLQNGDSEETIKPVQTRPDALEIQRKDNQLYEAINLLKGAHLISTGRSAHPDEP